MASSDLRAELDCSVCLNIYTDPVMLKCGHNFCRACIERVFDTQGECGVYFCPQCRDEFQERPALHRNITLRNISQQFLSVTPEEIGVSCTYCIHAVVPAVSSCLHCEASLCDDHVRAHSKSPEHILCDPTTSLQNRKCSVHKKVLEFYCTKDSACICASCCSSAEHRGHPVETLQEASSRKKNELEHHLQQLITMKEEADIRVRSLHEHRAKAQGKANGEAKRVSALFRDLRRRLEELERGILRDISSQEEHFLQPVNDLIQQLEVKRDELSRKIHDIQELCHMTDPLTILQEPGTGDLRDTQAGLLDRMRHDLVLYGGRDLDVCGTSHTFRSGVSDILTAVIGGIYVPKAEDLLLNEDTAHGYAEISADMRTLSRSGADHVRPYFRGRFRDYIQVLGSRSFSSGRHYWEVDVGRSNNWSIGVSYNTIHRKGDSSLIGENRVSWGLSRTGKQYMAVHDREEHPLEDNLPCERVRVLLDYEAGQLSFYISDPIEHLHTFSAHFTKALYPILGVWHSSISLC